MAIKEFGFEISEWCAELSNFSPKVFTTCNGGKKTLAGGTIEAISIHAAGQTFKISIDIWAGYQPVENCWYLGSEALNFCHKWCGPGPSPTEAEWTDQLEAYIYAELEDLESFFPDIPKIEYNLNAGQIAGIIIAILAAILYAISAPLNPAAS